MSIRIALFFIFFSSFGYSIEGSANAGMPNGSASGTAPAPIKTVEKSLQDQLMAIRSKISGHEAQLIDGLKNNVEAGQNLSKIKTLLGLQKEEARLGNERKNELENTLGELEKRRGILREHIMIQQNQLRKRLQDLSRVINEAPTMRPQAALPEKEKWIAPRAYVMSKLAEKGLREVEELNADLEDSMRIESKIRDEQNELAYMSHELEEQASVLMLNQTLQADILKRKHHDHLTQIENYRKLKSAEAQVEGLLKEFNSRVELRQNLDTERKLQAEMRQLDQTGGFLALRGRLPKPVAGKIVAQFGKAFDLQSQLQIFRKGIELSTSPYDTVRAVASGKVAFVGNMANYGNLLIIDHGQNYYSLTARLGAFQKKKGDDVRSGEVVAQANDAGTPLYFEIRARNVAVNPLQWLAN